MRGDHEELKILLKNHLIPSRFNQELTKEEKIHQFLKGNFRENFGPFDPMEGLIDGHDPMMIVGHQCEAIVTTITRQMRHAHAAIRPRSRGDRFTMATIMGFNCAPRFP